MRLYDEDDTEAKEDTKYIKLFFLGVILIFASLFFMTPETSNLSKNVPQNVPQDIDISYNKDYSSLISIGNTYWENNQNDKAIEAYEKAVKLDNNRIEGLERLSLILSVTKISGGPERLLSISKKLLSINKNNHFYWQSLALAYEDLNMPEEANKAWDESERLLDRM